MLEFSASRFILWLYISSTFILILMTFLLKAILLITLVATLQANTRDHTLSHFDKEFKNLVHSYQ